MVTNILDRLLDQRKVCVTMNDQVRATLRECCTRDLSNGGRGIRNQLEAWLINPLARALFDQNVEAVPKSRFPPWRNRTVYQPLH